jgi:CIC family chloride channel protein
MQTNVVSLDRQDSMEKALHLFERHQFSMFPVLDPEGRVLGMLTKDDLLKAYDQKVLKDRVLSTQQAKT